MQLPNCCYRVSIKALILNKTRDKFLIAKEDNGYWGLPGGGLDHGETPQADLPREIMEEMGLTTTWVADQPSYFQTARQTMNPTVRIANVIYECTLANLAFTPSSECVEIAFVNKDTIEDLQLFSDVKELVQMFDPERHTS